MNDLRSKIIINIDKGLEMNILQKEDVVQIIEHCGKKLNLSTISNYATENNMSYNGVKNFRNTIKLFNVKFVIG
jgi:hypothetical protein